MQKIKRLHQHWNFPVLLLLCAALLVTGCQPKKKTSGADESIASAEPYSASTYAERRSRSGSAITAKSSDNLGIQGQWENRAKGLVLDTASVAKGTPYVFGGTTLSGFDCSGLVRWAYSSVGVNLPRSAREQSQYGEKVDRDDLRMGDIVAFRHPKRGYHTGIYLGEGKFIHSPRRRDVVKISSLTDAYYRDTYLGARRPPLSNDVDLDEVEEQLSSLKAQKKALQMAQNSRNLRNDSKISENARKKGQQSAQRSSNSKKKNDKKSSSKKSADSKTKSNKAGKTTEKAKASESRSKKETASTTRATASKETTKKSEKSSARNSGKSSDKKSGSSTQKASAEKKSEKAKASTKQSDKPKATAAKASGKGKATPAKAAKR